MLKASNTIEMNAIDQVARNEHFSGAAMLKGKEGVLYQGAFGYADRVNERENTIYTRFGNASGCKFFTAIAIGQLVDQELLSFDLKLIDILEEEFPHFDEDITIHHLLTHTSGIPDYFDEDVMEDYEDLWKETPMYSITSLANFLPLFQHEKMKFTPGEKFHYNNAGFIVLGLVVEKLTGETIQSYIHTNIFEKADMKDSGYFALDRLPKNTANGYIDFKDGTWKTNIYSIPIIGASDGGAYITAPDMILFWEALIENKLLTETTTKLLLTPHVEVNEEVSYGYGVWINYKDEQISKYHVMGYDPGVSFHSTYYPQTGLKLAVPSNKSVGAKAIMKALEEHFNNKRSHLCH